MTSSDRDRRIRLFNSTEHVAPRMKAAMSPHCWTRILHGER
jgi:hypothetical protein